MLACAALQFNWGAANCGKGRLREACSGSSNLHPHRSCATLVNTQGAGGAVPLATAAQFRPNDATPTTTSAVRTFPPRQSQCLGSSTATELAAHCLADRASRHCDLNFNCWYGFKLMQEVVRDHPEVLSLPVHPVLTFMGKPMPMFVYDTLFGSNHHRL